jgi:hypothetical protein
MKRIALAVAEYLLGFLALALFAYLAFSSGPPSDERFVFAFKVAGFVALLEMAALWWRAAPANRLIVGANLWLVAGGLAAFTQQWWWLQAYQRLGESGLFISMLLVGVVSTAFSDLGFIGAPDERRRVLALSIVLLLAVSVALLVSVRFRGTVQWAAVVPVIALSWLQRLLRRLVRRPA